MPEAVHCGRCGSRLPAEAPPGSCSTCLLEFGIHGYSEDSSVSGGSAKASHLRLLGDYGDYELIEEIARGGMGVVCRARQKSLNRIVAVKLILIGQWAGPAHIERFKAEAEAAARLDHPNIVPIYEIGEQDGQHFFSMKLIEGQSLATVAASRRSAAISPNQSAALLRDAATMVAKIARAVHYAHQRRVLHRDLKPTNILIDAQGEPYLTDFGLAKVIERASSLTHTAAVLGTPSYMAPEQASGKAKQVTTAADIYSLGAVLYELLTGRPPFIGETPLETLDLVRESQPTPPRSIQPNVDRDLETICLKCLRKEPERRYGSAEALAEDLERWLEGKPVLARPVTPLERLWLWSRRKPAIATLAATVALLVIATAIGSTVMSFRIAAARDEARRQAEANRQQLVRLNVATGVQLLEAGDHFTALPWLGEALRLEGGAAVRETSHRMRLHAALRECPQLTQLWLHENFADFASFSPDASRVVTCGFDGAARVWNARTGVAVTEALWHTNLTFAHGQNYPVLRVRHADWSPDGRWLLTVCNYGARVWDAGTGQLIAHVEHEGEIRSAFFSPDGQLFLTAGDDRTTRFWDAKSGLPDGEPLRHASAVNWAVFSPDGRRVATACQKDGAQVWDTKTRLPVGKLLSHRASVRRVAFSPDGTRVVTSSDEDVAQVWDSETGQPVGASLKHRSEVRFAVFSPDGRRVATASGDRSAQVWDATTGKPITPSLVHQALVDIVRFSPDGRSVVSAGFDNTARVWDAQTGAPLTPPLPHNHIVPAVAFHPDGRQLLTASHDGAVRLWTLPARAAPAEPMRAVCDFQIPFSADGQLTLFPKDENGLRVWHLPSGRELAGPLPGSERTIYAAVTPDGRRALTVDLDFTHRVWDAPAGRMALPEWKRHISFDSSLFASPVFSQSGERFAAVDGKETVRIYSVAGGGRTVMSLTGELGVMALAFSPDEKMLATGNQKLQVRIWNSETGQPLSNHLPHEAELRALTFSTDATWLASASQDGVVKIWNTRTGSLAAPTLLHPRAVVFIRFSADGRQLVTVSDDKRVRVWDWRAGKLLTAPLVHDTYVKHATFNPDATRLVTIDDVFRAQVWDLATGQRINLPGRKPEIPAREILSAASEWPWDPAKDDRPAADLVALTQLLSGRRIDGESGLVPLDRHQLRELWRTHQNRERND